LADWLPDAIDVIASHEPEFDDAAIIRLRAARKEAGERIALLDQPPPPGDLPDAAAIGAIHHDLVEARALGEQISGNQALGRQIGAEAVATLRTQADEPAGRPPSGRPGRRLPIGPPREKIAV